MRQCGRLPGLLSHPRPDTGGKRRGRGGAYGGGGGGGGNVAIIMKERGYKSRWFVFGRHHFRSNRTNINMKVMARSIVFLRECPFKC